MPQGWTPGPAPSASDTSDPSWIRADGTKKGSGFLGVLTRPDGKVSSEISIGVNIDGKEVEIPTLVPTLTQQERDWLLTNDISDPKKIPQSIQQKAIDFAKPRLAAGKSPFASAAESPASATSAWTPGPAPGTPAPNWTADYPKTAQIARGVVNTLPAIGAAAGGLLAAPAAAAASGTVVGMPAGLAIEAGGVGLGAGAGRGLRDLIAEGIGLEPGSKLIEKGGRIALDTAEAGLAQMVLPALVEAMRTPGRTVKEAFKAVEKSLPELAKKVLPKLPEGVKTAPAAVLERPAWQAWEEYLPKPPAPPPPGTTGTSMTPAPMTAPRPAPVTAAPVAQPSVPAAAPAPSPASAALPDQRALNDAAIAARRSAYQASQTPAPTAAAPTGPPMPESWKPLIVSPEMQPVMQGATKTIATLEKELDAAIKAAGEKPLPTKERLAVLHLMSRGQYSAADALSMLKQ